ncbi:ghrelin/obestatin prepropeptide isoform X2 [Triplophysa dalaica]|uniref:ghrelin/obestatin prepropeptide isoform X2 n=1 Tax=Triplophysa dalaica TaxID=1582913 RepID=UPI0024DFD461|nr:ghrelin/obestatin prepropeptide isoform X2 [Triplophysa dalaica]
MFEIPRCSYKSEKQTFVCRPKEAIRSSERLNRTFAKTKMKHHWRASHVFVLLCAFSLCVEIVSCGTSFLSPAQKPQGQRERRPPRTSRRDAGDPEISVLREDGKFMVSAPFELGMSLSEAEYEKYGPVLQKIVVNLLSNSPFE